MVPHQNRFDRTHLLRALADPRSEGKDGPDRPDFQRFHGELLKLAAVRVAVGCNTFLGVFSRVNKKPCAARS
jgi:hypothetical protein